VPVIAQLSTADLSASTLSTYLFTPVGAVNAVNFAAAPAPRAVEGETVASTAVFAAAPAPREIGAVPGDEAILSATTLVQLGAESPAPTAAVEAAIAPELPETTDATWGWIGALGAAVSAGAYWMLRRARLARNAKTVPLWNGKAWPFGTILSTDLGPA